MHIPFRRRDRAPAPAPPADVRTIDGPAGPPLSARPDPAITQLAAEQQGRHDAAAKMYDTDGISQHTPLVHDDRTAAQLNQWTHQAEQDQVASERDADRLVAEQQAAATRAAATRDTAEQRLQQARDDADRHRTTLLGTGDPRWADPARLDESSLAGWSRTTAIPVLAVLLEVPLNALALQPLGGGALETTALAITIGAVGVLAPHSAGKHARAAQRNTWAGRLSACVVPAALTACLLAVALFISSIRTGFLAQPTIDPTTFTNGPSALAAAHIPSGVVFLGWLAVLTAIWLVVATTAFRNHNPHVAAHRRANQQVLQLEDNLPQLRSTETAALLAAAAATLDREHRLARQWTAYRSELTARAAESRANYAHGLAVGMADPEFTSALEAREPEDIPGTTKAA